MPLYAILVREHFPAKIMGSVFGVVAMISTLGMALRAAIGRLAVRPARRVWVALCRVVHDRHRGGVDGDDRATAPGRARRGSRRPSPNRLRRAALANGIKSSAIIQPEDQRRQRRQIDDERGWLVVPRTLMGDCIATVAVPGSAVAGSIGIYQSAPVSRFGDAKPIAGARHRREVADRQHRRAVAGGYAQIGQDSAPADRPTSPSGNRLSVVIPLMRARARRRKADSDRAPDAEPRDAPDRRAAASRACASWFHFALLAELRAHE